MFGLNNDFFGLTFRAAGVEGFGSIIILFLNFLRYQIIEEKPDFSLLIILY